MWVNVGVVMQNQTKTLKHVAQVSQELQNQLMWKFNWKLRPLRSVNAYRAQYYDNSKGVAIWQISVS